MNHNEPTFAIKDCALAAMATGRRAQSLPELRMILQDIPESSIYFHFWGTLLRPDFSDREFGNDFASWARHSLHDAVLAERLAVIDPTDFYRLENLRYELIEVIEQRLEETEVVRWARSDEMFQFMRSIIVVFDTHRHVGGPHELAEMLPTMSAGSIFYHFIDARRRTEEGIDDFQAWLQGLSPECDDLCRDLAGVDPFFGTLVTLRARLSSVFEAHFPERPATEGSSR
jgi:hypothetical protein